jgi:broad specificity phosphatase PhoE
MMAEFNTVTSSYLKYSTIVGYFLQADPDTDPHEFDFVSTNFGLIDRIYDTDSPLDNGNKTQWERFERKVRSLDSEAGEHATYKVLFLGRHGEGHHNVAESFYGTELWDCHWSLLNGNGIVTWDDARLTEVGKAQARTIHNAWAKQIENKIPPPESYYVSPLNRCLSTARITFDGLGLPNTIPFQPIVKELLRETLGIHTCDRRSPKSAIEREYPLYKIEDGFVETDLLWEPDLRESDSARTARLRKFLDDVFTNDPATFISFSTHSGAITSILEAIEHRSFDLATGAMIPVLVKAERVLGPSPPTAIEPPSLVPECKSDPLAFSAEPFPTSA